jgi:murein DD-endopeptidase MepM/ murein hydrolase activator NlpD
MRGSRESGILAQQASAGRGRSLAFGVGHWIVLGVLALSGMAAFGIAPDTTLDLPTIRMVERPLPLPSIASAPDIDEPYWREERVQRGDTIGSLLARAGVDDAEALAFVRTQPLARPLYQLKPGRPVRVAVDDTGRLAALRFLTPQGDVLTIERGEADALATRTETPVENVRLTLKSGVIASSLFQAADAVDLPDAVTVALAELFAGDIDFLQDLRRGDRFSVLYETRYAEGEPVGTGRIVAAEFENRGERLTAFLWQDAEGRDAWYAADGRSTRKAFLRSPVEFSRMSSGFSLARFHPILQTWRAHRGIDFAAPTGTPVRAVADGVVGVVATQNGYGNVIVLRHHGAYSTLYAHLSKFAPQLKAGARVRQGDTIGFVGATGWATGPHLHYEFRVNDEARNPLRIAFPDAGPLPPETRVEFAAHIEPLAQQLALVRELEASLVASRD